MRFLRISYSDLLEMPTEYYDKAIEMMQEQHDEMEDL